MFTNLFAAIFRSSVSLVGAILTTISAVSFLVLFVAGELSPSLLNSHLRIVAFVLLPVVFVVGLVLIPLGQWRLRKKGGATRALVIDFNHARTRYVAAGVSALTVVNLAIVSTATYKGVETMDSISFCGGACHTVMNPEFTAHQRSSHSKVKCTTCHVGSGAEYFVQGKASGIRQLISLATERYSRPIPTPVERLRPANQTCGECHARTRVEPDRLRVIDRFAEDETNTWNKTVLLNRTSAMHWHIDHTVRFKSDVRRVFVSQVELPLADGGVEQWSNTSRERPDAGSLSSHWRTMDCTDCHNRTAHAYERPKDEIDRALARGELDRTLPFIRREALKVVQQRFANVNEARSGIAGALHAFYRAQYTGDAAILPERIDEAAKQLSAIYERNVFPSMNIEWNTYPDFRAHEENSGCFRCHTRDLEAASGRRISARCELCHLTLAEEEKDPEVLESLSAE